MGLEPFRETGLLDPKVDLGVAHRLRAFPRVEAGGPLRPHRALHVPRASCPRARRETRALWVARRLGLFGRSADAVAEIRMAAIVRAAHGGVLGTPEISFLVARCAAQLCRSRVATALCW